ncbi:LLM class flavin-dependent oxidoreductase [Streptomyces sp. NPDC002206]
MTGPSATGRSPCRSVPRGPITEYEAYGLTLVPPGEGIARLAETVHILKRMWTEDVFDFEGRHYRLRGTWNEPKPVQRPGPPLLIGGWGTQLLRLGAEQADIWNIPGPPHNSVEFIAERGRSRCHPYDGRRTRRHRSQPCCPRPACALSARRRALAGGRDHREGRWATP